MLKEMSEVLLRNPRKPPSSEAAHVALFFANVAWNECVGIDHAREGYRNVWEEIEADNPALWNEFTSNDIDGMIDELVQYKQNTFQMTSGESSLAVSPKGESVLNGCHLLLPASIPNGKCNCTDW